MKGPLTGIPIGTANRVAKPVFRDIMIAIIKIFQNKRYNIDNVERICLMAQLLGGLMMMQETQHSRKYTRDEVADMIALNIKEGYDRAKESENMK